MRPALVLWFTGLSGAGKTTVASEAVSALEAQGRRTLILDGDVIRSTVHRHLGYSKPDILENNRLIASLCRDELKNTDVILVPIISPLREGRERARAEIGDTFRLVHFSAGLEHVETADVKGLYRRARSGEIADMIGIADSNPYEPPTDADLTIDISRETRPKSVHRLVNYVGSELNE